MKSDKQPLILPWDFTLVAEHALKHAIKFAKASDSHIIIAHILDDKGSHAKKLQEIGEFRDKVQAICDKLKTEHSITAVPSIRKGSIFETINEIAVEFNANIIVMGTHGLSNMQKLTGSKALKVIEGSVVPYLVVQEPPSENDAVHNITFPLEYSAESLEKLKYASFLSKFYKLKIQIFAKNYTDGSLVRKLGSNIQAAKNYLHKNSLEYDLFQADSKGKFQDLLVDFAVKQNSNFIIIATTKGINTADYVLGTPEQAVIANEAKIPVLVVNPSKLSNVKFNPY